MHGGQIRNRRLYCQRSRPVPKAVFRAGRGGQWVHYFVALVRESKGDEFIRGRMKKVVDSNIETMVESKAKSFVNELRKRYDMAFAAFVVDNMRKQNMLKEDKIAELLKDNPNEK